MHAGQTAAEQPSLARRSAVEAVGTAFLLIAVVGSGIMADRLAPGLPATALLANSVATGFALVALILAGAPYSGAHFNPLVTLADCALRRRPWREAAAYGVAQGLGALAGVAAADAMFREPLFTLSRRVRGGSGQILGEFLAAFGLLTIVFLASRSNDAAVAVAVGAYITAAYWFTSSTSFANPAVTLARSLTDTFTGIRPRDVPGFLIGQFAALAVFCPAFWWLTGARTPRKTP